MQSLTAFLTAHWTAILTYLALGTALTKILDKAAKRFPKLQPVATVVDELVIDAWDVVKAVAGVFGLSLGKAAEDVARKALILIVALLALVGCTKQEARTAVDAASAGCMLIKSLDSTVGDICATENELAPFVKHLLAARRVHKLGAASGAKEPPVDACTVPLEEPGR